MIYLQKAIFKNVAPFGDLDLTFDQGQVIIFSGVNGRGKTTILSYVADAFFEFAREAGFDDVFENKHKYYRICSPSSILGGQKFSLAYFRFKCENDNFDYVEIVGELTAKEYNGIVDLEQKINFEKFDETLKNQNSYKHVFVDSQKAKDVFKKNILTYFPSDRLEVPAWLNETEYKNHRFNTRQKFSENLDKNIESRVVSHQIANWVLDVILDEMINDKKQYHSQIHNGLNIIIQKILSTKGVDNCRIGISPRNNSNYRVSIVKDEIDKSVSIVSPSIFHLSSGEMALFILFAEIIKQYDLNSNGDKFMVSDISGIVVVDEIDKHLHMKLQKEILPLLIKAFPNLQFILSSLTGKNTLKQIYEVFSRSNPYGKTLFVWDCDALNDVGGLLETETVFKFVFQQNSLNTKVKKGIENLFSKDLFEQKYYKTRNVVDDYGCKKIIEEFDKNSFCQFVNGLTEKEVFSLFQPMIDKMRSLVN